MFSFRKHLLLPATLVLSAVPQIASAQDANFMPLMATFTGKEALVLSPTPSLDINGFGTVEFWVQAGWTGDAGYDPAIMGYSGSSGARFGIYLTRDAQALGIQAGPYYDTIDFDFSDGQLHYVALSVIDDTISVMIDGELQDTLGFGFADLPGTSFSIGSIGRFSPFIGRIGQVRIWDEPIEPDTLVNFSWREIAADGPGAHPDIDALVGVSAFGNPETGGFVFVGDPDDPEIVATQNAVDAAQSQP